MKKWARILCLLFICAFVGVMCTACLPLQDDNSDFDDYDPDDPESTPGFYPDKMDLYGTKVLYHPLDYKVDVGEGNDVDYFGKY